MKTLTHPVWKALHVHADSTPAQLLHEAASFASPSLVGILLDTADAQARGGTGRAFDWSVAKSLSADLSIVSRIDRFHFHSSFLTFFLQILAGGLHPENVSSAVHSVCPFAVDVSSGVESAGEKDLSKIEAFLTNVRK